MHQQLSFNNKIQMPIIENGKSVNNAFLPGAIPNYPLIHGASDLWRAGAFNMPSRFTLKFDVSGQMYEFWMNIEVDARYKSKTPDQTFLRPIPSNCPINSATYIGQMRINCICITNPTYFQSMYALVRVVNAVNVGTRHDIIAKVVLEVSLRTGFSYSANMLGGGFEDRRWDKTVKYVHVLARHIPGPEKDRVTEGMQF